MAGFLSVYSRGDFRGILEIWIQILKENFRLVLERGFIGPGAAV